MNEYLEERKTVHSFAKKMWEAGMVVGAAGNVSLRLPDKDRYVITPTSISYDKLTMEEIVVIDSNRDVIIGERGPSFESGVHLAIYSAREDIHAIFHTHSVYASVLAVTGKLLPPILEEIVPYLGGEIEVAQYAPSGSDELAENVLRSLGPRMAVILANHGVFCCGMKVERAFKNAQLVEHAAKVYVLALSAGEGKITTLPPEVVEMEKEMYNFAKEV